MNIVLKNNKCKSTGKRKRNIVKTIKNEKYLYLLTFPGLLMIILFKYLPMYGIVIGFMNYKATIPILSNQWVGLLHFKNFFTDPYCYRVIRNTFILGIYTLAFGFPAPIILALILNEVKWKHFKRITQTISYLPHFVSTAVIVGIVMTMFSLDGGIVNHIIKAMGGEPIPFLIRPEWFRPLYIGSSIWQSVGFGSVIYLAALSGVNPELYEAAIIDGANRWRRIISITIPAIVPTITIMLILALGRILSSDFTKIFLMYSPLTYETADVINTYTYRQAFSSGNLSYSAAVGLVNSVVNMVFLATFNGLFRKFSENSLW